MLAKLRSRLTYANVMVTALMFIVLGGGAYAAIQFPNNSVKSKHIAPNAAVGADVKESSLVGVRPYGRVIPAGTRVTGSWGGETSTAAAGEFTSYLVSLPAPAPVALATNTVNFAPGTLTSDDDPECTGSEEAPTAPPGKVCIYPGPHVRGVTSLDGNATDGDNSRSDRRSFLVVASFDDSGDATPVGTWAYTAP